MNTLKAIQHCFPRARSSLFPQPDKSNSRRRPTICFSNSEGPEASNPSVPDGDKQKQELLAQIAMLQAQRVRLTDFLDDRSAHLSQLAEEATAELDAIGENALKELDDASSRILDKLESRMQAFEESAEMNRQEIESNERILEEFEEQIARGRNEGLFFKNLSLMSLMVLAVGNALFTSPEIEWKKVGALSLILAGLLAQFIYEQSTSLDIDINVA